LQFIRWQNLFTVLPAAFWFGLLIHLFRVETNLATLLHRHPRLMGLLLAVTLIYALGISFVIFPLAQPEWVSWLMTTAALLMGMSVAYLDAAENGEAFWPHVARSFDYTFFTALLFGGQIALAMFFSGGVTFHMMLLLLTIITTAVFIQAFAAHFQTFVDRIAFFNAPQVRATRAALRVAAEAAPRVNTNLNLEQLDRDEFARLTRRALSHMGDLPKLANSPLTRLPLVEARLIEQDTQLSTLTRAAELKVVLTESIERLRPPLEEVARTTDEWRHYNALYVPYVLGLKPYRQRPGSVLVPLWQPDLCQRLRSLLPATKPVTRPIMI
jgi:hypothetical protein